MTLEEKDSKSPASSDGTESTEVSDKGLGLRDALEVAVLATEDKPAEGAVVEKAPPVEKAAAPEVPALQPPAEWNKEEKEDFAQSSRKSQEAALRLHKSHNSKIEQIKAATSEMKQEKADLEWVKQTVKEVEPFLRARGEKEPAHALVLKAVQAMNELDKDPIQAAIAVFKAKKQPIPPALMTAFEKKADQIEAGENSPLQKRLEAVESELAQEKQTKAANILNAAFQAFEGEKNAAGKARFPDVDNSPAGLELSGNIGSLVTGGHKDSKAFASFLQARIPNASHQQLLEAAYWWFGGKRDDSTEDTRTQTQSSKSHIKNAQRAAASVPGRAGNTTSSGPVKKYKTTREAAEAALAQLRE